jgi:hypothetical protein
MRNNDERRHRPYCAKAFVQSDLEFNQRGATSAFGVSKAFSG